MQNYIYDIETYPNVFTLSVLHHETGAEGTFEISDRRHDGLALKQFCDSIAQDRMIGFNNLAFDYPVLHLILKQPKSITNLEIYQKVQEIIKGQDGNRFASIIWDDKQFVPQLDLFKLHHYDNPAKSTGLKILEFNMRSDKIGELPFIVGSNLTFDQIDVLIQYNLHDVRETRNFFEISAEQVAFRDSLGRKYWSYPDAKIGREYFITALEDDRPGVCFHKVNGKRTARQTIRDDIDVNSLILPVISFKQPEFNRVLEFFRAQRMDPGLTKNVFKKLYADVGDFRFAFGAGGIHGSIESEVIVADEENIILDLDVTSFYPSIAIVNNVYPAHLGVAFCNIYASLKARRMTFAKGTAENNALKLSLNGVYGDSNNAYSPFYDTAYTMSITINGQLLLCMLAERLLTTPGIRILQCNTDGITIQCPRKYLWYIQDLCASWSELTGLSLEQAEYSRFFIRDVNNYIAEKTDGSLKRKGAYEYKLDFHKDHSFLIVQKAAEAAMVHGLDVAQFIRNHPDNLDFCGRTKVPRSSKLMLGDKQVQNITRYYVSTDGGTLTKVMPPLKHKTEPRNMRINVGWLANECNNVADFDRNKINYDFYIQEACKLVIDQL